MISVGMWVHKTGPNMNTFLQPFVDEANDLSNIGIEWQMNGENILSKIYPVCCCVDSVTRPCLLNINQFNGHSGCNFCEHPTEPVDGYRKYPVSINVPPSRTDFSIRESMERAMIDDINPTLNKGIKGPSVLMNLQGFDLVHGVVPDYMHSVLLGVTKQYTDSLLSPANLIKKVREN